ncbi:MAG: alpha/beta hydrolase-fold protein [Planctomycetaceae bacterium]
MGPAIQTHPESYPFIAVFPQVEDLTGRYLEGWLAESPDGIKAIRILDDVISRYSVDTNKQILTGWSMGGYGAWSLAAQSPERWSAVLPLSGGGQPDWAEKLKDTPIWSLHGLDDYVVLPEESEKLETAFTELGEPHHAAFSYVKQTGHDVWRNVYGYTGVVKWMLDPVPDHLLNMTLAAGD